MKERRNFKYYWEFIDLPILILIIWTVISILPIKDYVPGFVLSIINWILLISVFCYIGYIIAKVKSNTPKDSAKAGAYAGVIVGFVSAIVSIITFYIYPSFFDATIQQMTAGGINYDSAMLFLKIGLYSAIITGPLFSGLIGAFISWVAGLITKKKIK